MSAGNEDPTKQFKASMGRPMSSMESLYHYMVERDNSTVCSHVIVVKANQKLDENDVRNAFVTMSRSQEALRMRIIREENNPNNEVNFLFSPRENPGQIDYESTTLEKKGDWPTLVNEICKEPLDTLNGPLWRATFAHVTERDKADSITCFEHVIIFTIHHAIVDGISAFDFLYRQFLPVLSAIANGERADGMVSPIPLLKPSEAALFGKVKTSWYQKVLFNIVWTAFHWKARIFGRKEYAKLKFVNEMSSPERDNSNEPFAIAFLLSREVTRFIISSAKNNGVSVHSVLLVASSMALTAAYIEANLTPPAEITVVWPIDVREHAGLRSPQPLGVYHCNGNSTIKVPNDPSQEQFWTLCQSAFSDVKKKALLPNYLEFFTKVQIMGDILKESKFQEFVNDIDLTHHAVLSNLGNCDAGPKPLLTEGKYNLKLTEYYRTITGVSFGDKPPYFFHGVATVNGQLSWTLSLKKSKVSQKFAHTIMEKIPEILEEYCTQTQGTEV